MCAIGVALGSSCTSATAALDASHTDVAGIARMGVGGVQNADSGVTDVPDQGVGRGRTAALVGVDVVERSRIVEGRAWRVGREAAIALMDDVDVVHPAASRYVLEHHPYAGFRIVAVDHAVLDVDVRAL